IPSLVLPSRVVLLSLMSSSDPPAPPPAPTADPAIAQAPAPLAVDAAAAAAAVAAPAAGAAAETAVSPSTTTAVGPEMPPPTPMKSRRKSSRKRKPKAFTPGVNLTSGLTNEMRNTKTTEEFENDLEASTVNRMVENVRSVIPSLSDLSLAFTTAQKSVSDLSTAASGVAQKASKSVSDLSVAATGAAQKASKSVSDLSVAATGAAQKASEHAFSFTAAMSDMSQKMADGAKAALDTAAAAKQRTTDAYNAASATATAVTEKVSAATKSISETTTAIMEGATAAKAKINEVSKAASDATKAVVDTAAPVVSAVSSGVAAAATSVSDVVSSTASSGGATSGSAVSETHIGVLPGGPASSGSSAEVIKDYMAATSLAATTAMNKFSGLSRSLTSLFSQGSQGKWSGGGAATPPPYKSRDKDDAECVALADLSPMPAIAYKGNRSPPNSEGSNSGGGTSDVAKLVSNNENVTVYDCEIEKTYVQSTGTNSFESVVPLMEKEINCGPMTKHPVIGRAHLAKPVQLVGSELPSKRVEEWALRHIERAEEAPKDAVPQTRLGDRETFMLNQLAQKIQTKFLSMKRQDFTLTMTRGFDPNGLPFLEVEVSPVN
ncbi:hypothetical protein PRIPAC_88027, partial [Pristionchus pacificus]